MTHGHELMGELLEGRGIPGGRGPRGKNLDSCNSIMNKIYFKNKAIKAAHYTYINAIHRHSN